MRVSRAIVLLSIVLTSGCGDSPPTPFVPSSAAPANPPSSNALTGYVADTAFRAIADARVEVVDGPQAGVSTTSWTNGQFYLAGTFPSMTTLRVAKEGYITATSTSPAPRAQGSTPFVFVPLDLVAAPVDVAGDYTLTLIADSACTDIPSDLRTRTYPVTIARQSDPRIRTGSSLTLTAGGASLLANHDGFPIGVAGGEVGFSLYYKQEGFGLVEQIAPATFLAVQGTASASVGSTPPVTISAPLDGIVDYCALQSASGWNDDCNSGPRIAYRRCESKNHRLILTRR